nr:uncharacterized protein CTRU02_06628 [Colletotrichum truncatum]KAF6792545.1 hypothetical protein CTRU02_06628 [Colletotrichum truncatum]
MVPLSKMTLSKVTNARGHETALSLYDPNKQSREKERKRRETSEPLAHRSKRTLPYRQDVMDSFRSEAILQDRLTLQPCIIPGLFQNGRASSPKRVEELAFNSIAVRENPQSRQSLRHQHNRSQGRKLQRGERVANEVQTFVGRPKTSTNEVLELPPYQLHDIYVDWRSRQQHDFGSYDERYDKEREPIGPPERTYGEQAKEQGHLRNEYSSLSPFQRPSSNETTNYSSWSMNNNEELSVSHQPGLRHSSDTPEPIRKSMRETGVFDGTGITGKDRNSRTEAFAVDKLFRHTDDLLERGRYATQEHNSRPHITIVQQPAIFHYRDKGTMATAEPLAMSQTQFSTKAVTKLEHGDVVNCTTKLGSPGTHMESHGLLPSDVIRQTTDRSVQVESGIFSSQCEDYTRNQVYITEQERSNPQRREISTQTSPKANVQTQAQTPESTKNAFLNNMNMRSAIANAKVEEIRYQILLGPN